MGSTAISLMTASKNVAASQVLGTPQPQGSLSTAIYIPWTTLYPIANPTNISPGILAVAEPANNLTIADASQSHNGDVLVKASPSNDDTPTSSTRISVGIDGETTNQNAHFRSAQSVPDVSNHPSTTAKTSITTDGLNLQVPNRKTSFANRASTSNPILDINTPESLSSRATTMPDFSKKSLLLTISGQYSIDSQPLTKGSLITVSGTTISPAPNESHIIVEASTEAFGPSVTAKLGSGPNETEVQKFSGNALGARDGLWGSSMMFLVFFVVLLWL